MWSGGSDELRVARAGWFVAKDEHVPGQMLMLWAKGTNIPESERDGYPFTFESVTLPDGTETSRIVWGTDRVPVTAEEYISGSRPPRHGGTLHEDIKISDDFEVEWLRSYLMQNGPTFANTIKQEALKRRIQTSTLYHARGIIWRDYREGPGAARKALEAA